MRGWFVCARRLTQQLSRNTDDSGGLRATAVDVCQPLVCCVPFLTGVTCMSRPMCLPLVTFFSILYTFFFFFSCLCAYVVMTGNEIFLPHSHALLNISQIVHLPAAR